MTTTTTTAPFVFDGDYDNLDQVAHLWEAYAAQHHTIRRLGRYPYNDSFKGRIDGLVADSKNEDTAIYLLQVTRHIREHQARVQNLRDEGYAEPELPATGTYHLRYTSIAIIGAQYHQGRDGTITIVDGGRIVTTDGTPQYVLPKGARTRGYCVSDSATVLAKK